jgi:hypothetical protein
VKHDPKLMKSKADKMLKSGAISEKEHKSLHKKADGELARMKFAKASEDDTAGDGAAEPTKDGKIKGGIDKLSATSKDDKGEVATAKMVGDDTASNDDPAGKFRKRGSDKVTRGQPIDAEEKDD